MSYFSTLYLCRVASLLEKKVLALCWDSIQLFCLIFCILFLLVYLALVAACMFILLYRGCGRYKIWIWTFCKEDMEEEGQNVMTLTLRDSLSSLRPLINIIHYTTQPRAVSSCCSCVFVVHYGGRAADPEERWGCGLPQQKREFLKQEHLEMPLL